MSIHTTKRLLAGLSDVGDNCSRNSQFFDRNIEFSLLSLLTARIPHNPLILASLKSDVGRFLKIGGSVTSQCFLQLRERMESANIRDMNFQQVTCVTHVLVAVEGGFAQSSFHSFVRFITEECKECLMAQIANAGGDVFNPPSNQVWPGTPEEYDALLCAFDLLKVSSDQLLLERIREGCQKWIEAAPLLQLDKKV